DFHVTGVQTCALPICNGDIVLIIDESIAGRYLDINDAAGVRSGLASPPPGITVSNFGIAASITNCSYGSNLTLRYGGTRGDYQRSEERRVGKECRSQW